MRNFFSEKMRKFEFVLALSKTTYFYEPLFSYTLGLAASKDSVVRV